MQYRPLGKSDVQISRIGLGCMMMGWRCNAAESRNIFSYAHDNGVNFIDSSISYGRGKSHEIIGKALASLKLKNKFLIATKVGGVSNDSDPPQNRGYSKQNIIRQCELSLTQLNIECIDLLQLHNPTNDYGLQEMLEALNLLMKQGKIKSYGICNYNIIDTKEILSYIKENSYPQPSTSQFEYNLINYREQRDLFQYLESTNLKTITWGPLAGGLLTDWYLDKTYLRPNSRIEMGREKNSKDIVLKKKSTRDILNKINSCCLELNISAQVFSLLWMLKKKPYNTPLIGPSSANQFIELVSAINNEKYKSIDFCSLNL